MRVSPPVCTGILLSALLLGVSAAPAGADATTDDAVAWLATQQQDDGGFEVAGFPGFETPDAVLAIASNAQTTSTWSASEALTAVQAVQNGEGEDALDYLDDFVDAGISGGQAAKVILLVAEPLGFDPTDFDPQSDSASAVDLTADLGDIPPLFYNSSLFADLAQVVLGEQVHQDDLQEICEVQHTSGPGAGGWSFDSNPDGADPDMDTTGFSVMALTAAGVEPTDEVLVAAQGFIEGTQQASGAWLSFGSDDPNATALAVLAYTALGEDPLSLPHDPDAWLRSQQDDTPPDEGHIISPNDGFGLNTFATSQTVTALHRNWLPLDSATGRRCLAQDPYTDTPQTTWYDNGARWLSESHIVAGHLLHPADRITRAQASMWLNRMFDSAGGPDTNFPDVPDNAWYHDGVDFVAAAPNGVIATGYPDGTFRPGLSLNRAQAVKWLYAAAGSPDIAGLPDDGFSDVADDAHYAAAVTWASANGIVFGFRNGTFRPRESANRAQFGQWLYELAATPGAWEDGATIPTTVVFT
jgi:S-layer homology domain